MKLFLKSVGAIAFAGLGVFILSASSRNAFGNPNDETLKQTCTLPNSSSVMRLYEGAGGIMVAFWYTVTLEEPNASERQVFYTFGHPSIKSLTCSDRTLAINLNDIQEKPRSFKIEELRAMRTQPKGIYNGKNEQRSQSSSFVNIARWTFGTISFLGSGLFGSAIARQLKSKKPTL